MSELVRAAAIQAGVHDPGDAVKMIGNQKKELSWEEAQALVADLLIAKPYLLRPEPPTRNAPTRRWPVSPAPRSTLVEYGRTTEPWPTPTQ